MTSVRVNGEPRELADGTTVAAVVAALDATGTGCAVALNDEVVPRREWPGRVLEAGDRLEILTAVQGG
jgi:sulfur carrier protein